MFGDVANEASVIKRAKVQVGMVVWWVNWSERGPVVVRGKVFKIEGGAAFFRRKKPVDIASQRFWATRADARVDMAKSVYEKHNARVNRMRKEIKDLTARLKEAEATLPPRP